MENYTIFVLIQKDSVGLVENLGKISKYNNENIAISARAFHSPDSLLEYIEKTEKPDYILVFDNIHYFNTNRDKARSETLEVLKTISLAHSDIKTVTVISKEREQETLPFIRGLISLNLHDFHLIDEITDLQIVLNWLIKEKRHLKDNAKYLNTDITKKEVTKEVVKEVVKVPEKESSAPQKAHKDKAQKTESKTDPAPAPVQKPAPAAQEAPKQEPAPKPAPPVKTRAAQQIIGVVGTAAGSGSTSLCIGYAKYLTEVMKEKVLILDRTENRHLSKVKITGIDVMEGPLANVKIADYDRIIIDFGPLAKVEVEGKVLLYADLINDKQIDRQYCNSIILAGSHLPWRLHEIKAFLEDGALKTVSEDWIFYLGGSPEYYQEKVKKQYTQHRTVFIHHEHREPMKDLDELLENRRK